MELIPVRMFPRVIYTGFLSEITPRIRPDGLLKGEHVHIIEAVPIFDAFLKNVEAIISLPSFLREIDQDHC